MRLKAHVQRLIKHIMRSFYKAAVRPTPCVQAVKLVDSCTNQGIDILDYFKKSREIANQIEEFDNAWIIITSNAVRNSVEIYNHNRKFLSGRRIGKERTACLQMTDGHSAVFARSHNKQASYCLSFQLDKDLKVSTMQFHYEELDKASVGAIHTLAKLYRRR